MMRTITLLLISLFLSTPSLAAIYKCKDENGKLTFKDRPCKINESDQNNKTQTLTFKSIQGKWQLLSMNGEANEDVDYWEFAGDEFYQNLSGRRMSPDYFTVKGQDIDLGGYKIEVTSFDGKQMQAVMGGFKYSLKKTDESVDLTPAKRKSLNAEQQKLVNDLGKGIQSADEKTAKLDCPSAVKNGKSWIDSMLSIGKKNYLDGYTKKSQYDSASAGLKKLKNRISLGECRSANGNTKKFYRCMSSINNHIATCGKKYNYNP